MYKPVKLSDKVFYIGVNDRRTALFENMWPLDRGVSYNSYLIDDEKVTIIDTVEVGQFEKWIAKVRSILNVAIPSLSILEVSLGYRLSRLLLLFDKHVLGHA